MKVPKTEPGVEMAGNVVEVEPVPLAIIHPKLLPPVIVCHGVPSTKEGQVLGQGQSVRNAQTTVVAGQEPLQGQSVQNAHTSAGGSYNTTKEHILVQSRSVRNSNTSAGGTCTREEHVWVQSYLERNAHTTILANCTKEVQPQLAKSAHTATVAAATHVREEQVTAQGPSPSNAPIVPVAISNRKEKILEHSPSTTSVPTASTVTSNRKDQVSVQEHFVRKTSELVVAPDSQKGHDKGKGILQVAASSKGDWTIVASLRCDKRRNWSTHLDLNAKIEQARDETQKLFPLRRLDCSGASRGFHV